MQDRAHEDIHTLLKNFGIAADERVQQYIARHKPSQPLKLRIVLEDLTPYAGSAPEKLRLEIEGDIQV